MPELHDTLRRKVIQPLLAKGWTPAGLLYHLEDKLTKKTAELGAEHVICEKLRAALEMTRILYPNIQPKEQDRP